MSELEKRDWCYIQQPAVYEIAPCPCGNTQTQWSEFKKHLWCDKCQKDFVPAHNGIFDGPIPAYTAMLMGISFDRINLATQQIVPFNVEGLYEKDSWFI